MAGDFSASEWLRYSRQVAVPGFGAAGQRRLRDSHVVVVGVGGLGSPAVQYLAAAGVGHLTLIDGDRVELSNLQRQVIYCDEDCGRAKAEVAAQRLAKLNPAVEVTAVAQWLSPGHEALFGAADLVLDCTDQYAARRLINRLSLRQGVPWSYASVGGLVTQSALFEPGGPCYECLFPQAPENPATCAADGVLGPLPGMAGAQQALTALRKLSGCSTVAPGLHLYDAMDNRHTQIALAREPHCVCAETEGVPLPGPQVPVDAPGDDRPGNDGPGNDGPGNDGPQEGEWGESGQQNRIDKFRQAGWQLVDLRTADEYAAFNLGDPRLSEQELLAGLRSGSLVGPLALYCQSGRRSQRAAAAARLAGANALSVPGGLLAVLVHSTGPGRSSAPAVVVHSPALTSAVRRRKT